MHLHHASLAFVALYWFGQLDFGHAVTPGGKLSLQT
jgi:hypothetical protein